MTARQAKINALRIAATLLNHPFDKDVKTEFYCRELSKELAKRADRMEALEKAAAKRKSLKKA